MLYALANICLLNYLSQGPTGLIFSEGLNPGSLSAYTDNVIILNKGEKYTQNTQTEAGIIQTGVICKD